VGSFGPGELVILLIVLVPTMLVFCGGPFVLGYFVGKSKGRREAALEQLSRSRSVGGAMLTPPLSTPPVEPGHDRPRA
jgi:hypothetical protein